MNDLWMLLGKTKY